MNYSFDKVASGLAKYLDKNLYSGMNDMQEIVARILVGRVLNRSEEIKTALSNNGLLRTFGVINHDGCIDVDGLVHDIKRQMESKGSIEISIPLFGKIKFVPEDIDDIHRCIMEA
jgi:hypothetical protein